jgi:hypothetical protein
LGWVDAIEFGTVTPVSKQNAFVVLLAACALLGEFGCANPVGNQPSGATFASAPIFTASASPSRITDRKGNTKGEVLILMYHKFAATETRYDRSYDHFRHDLQRLYDMGFRPVTMSEYLSDDLHIPSGASPVVITLDDANPTQFTMADDGSADPDCAVGIWQEFARTHPDFPVKATWYVLPTVMWGQRKWEDKKVETLKESGSELACHTWSHPILRNLTDKQVKTEIVRSVDFLGKYGFDKVSFAYPY